MTPIHDKLKKLAALKAEYRRIYKEYQEAKAEHDFYEQELFDEMREDGLLTLRTTEGVFSAKSTAYAQVNDMDAFAEWCRTNDLSDEFLREKEVGQRLNEYVRHALDTGEELPPGVGWYPKDYIAITTA